jgi:hypothetical protein
MISVLIILELLILIFVVLLIPYFFYVLIRGLINRKFKPKIGLLKTLLLIIFLPVVSLGISKVVNYKVATTFEWKKKDIGRIWIESPKPLAQQIERKEKIKEVLGKAVKELHIYNMSGQKTGIYLEATYIRYLKEAPNIEEVIPELLDKAAPYLKHFDKYKKDIYGVNCTILEGENSPSGVNLKTKLFFCKDKTDYFSIVISHVKGSKIYEEAAKRIEDSIVFL